jgi:hypothetical protein
MQALGCGEAGGREGSSLGGRGLIESTAGGRTPGVRGATRNHAALPPANCGAAGETHLMSVPGGVLGQPATVCS